MYIYIYIHIYLYIYISHIIYILVARRYHFDIQDSAKPHDGALKSASPTRARLRTSRYPPRRRYVLTSIYLTYIYPHIY